MEMIFFLIGTGVLGLTIVMAVRARHDTKKLTSTILLGILFTTFLYLLPTIEAKDRVDSVTAVPYKILYSLLYALKALGGRQTMGEIYATGLTGVLRYLYLGIFYAMFFTAPILSSALILSFFGDTGEKIQYALHFSEKCFVFSELNRNSVPMAKGIQKKVKGATIVFCNTKSDDGKLRAKAKKMGAICLYKSCVDFHVGRFHKNYEFYLVSDNEDENIKYACELLEKNKAVKSGKLTLNAFAQSGVGIDIVESIPQNNIKMRFVDQVALLCNQIIFKNPLYDIPNGSKDISVMIVGCGRTGMQMLKTVVWCGQIDGYSLKIRVYDNKNIADTFYAEAPELQSGEYDIQFITVDIQSREFEEEIARSMDATYVFVATGDDELNLETAARLRGVFRRKTGRYDLEPKILTRVRDDYKTANIKNSNYLAERNIVVFGNVADLFEDNLLFGSNIEKLALGVHLAYSEKLALARDSEGYQKACDIFYSREYERRSSMATALHLASKLRSCGVLASNERYLTNDAALAFEKALREEDGLLLKLAKNEHTRWNAFFQSEGYRSADISQIRQYCHFRGDSHKDKFSKLHPCITGWDNLNELSKDYDALMESLPPKPGADNNGKKEEKTDFAKYDKEIIKAIPTIIRFANQE